MEENNFGEPLLLKKQYYENCPGCKVDKAKELKTDVTFRNLFNIWMVVLCSCKKNIDFELCLHFGGNFLILFIIAFYFLIDLKNC